MDDQLQTYIMLRGVEGIKGKHFRTNKGLGVIFREWRETFLIASLSSSSHCFMTESG